MSKVFGLTNDAAVNATGNTCSIDNAEALMYVVPKPDEDDFFPLPYYVLFNFTGVSG